jgi:hypothetical protein
MTHAPAPLFREVQSFRNPRARILTAIPPAAMLLLAIWQVGLGHTWGKMPMSNPAVIGWTVFLWIIYLRLITVKLVTEVRQGEVRVAMRGLSRSHRIALDGVRSTTVIKFDPVRDWGGYGIRSTKRGRAYIASGTEGVQLNLADAGVVVIGSERPGELERAIGERIGRGARTA